ncbi:MAG: Thiolase [Gammaproteobacteria bacterium]|jgi:acetyl-CoA C-acetyltransferase|nr:Thiolase [Gammaproteobacteria bacterium]
MSLPRRNEGRAVYIVDGRRTPFLKAANRPGNLSASDLAVQAAAHLLLPYPILASDLDEVMIGNVMPSPDEANIARLIALRLGCGDAVPGVSVHRNCGSGMQALDMARFAIAEGRYDLVLAGGTEAMSRAPLLFPSQMSAWLGQWMSAKTLPDRLKVLAQFRLSQLKPIVALLKGLRDPVVNLSMGQTAEELAYRFHISREEMDQFANESHRRSAQAKKQGYFSYLSPVYDKYGTAYEYDTGVREDSSVAKLATLKPYFDKTYGLVTAGNSSQITDGACVLLLASAHAVKRFQLPVLGRFIDCQWAGLSPRYMGLGPVHAAIPLLQRYGLSIQDIDYWEINEAFAAQVIACFKAFADPDYCSEEFGGLAGAFGELDGSRVNVDGGAVALGHPLGASGARVILQLLYTMARNHARRGVAALCIGGGQGGAVLLERTDEGI